METNSRNTIYVFLFIANNLDACALYSPSPQLTPTIRLCYLDQCKRLNRCQPMHLIYWIFTNIYTHMSILSGIYINCTNANDFTCNASALEGIADTNALMRLVVNTICAS